MDDIGKIIQAVAEILALSGKVAGQAPSMISVPIEANVNSITNAETLLDQLIDSNTKIAKNEIALGLENATGPMKEQLEKDKKALEKAKKEAEKKAAERKKKKKKKDKSEQKDKNKTKIDKILEKIQVINDRLTQINEDIKKLEEAKAEVDEKVEAIVNDSGEEIVPEKDPALMTDKEKLEFKKKQLIAERTELKCKMARILATNEDNEQLSQLANVTQNKVLQEASKLPVNLIEVIEAIIDYLANLLAGIVSPKDEEEFNAKELLDEIKEKVTDLLGKIETLPVPKIPILSDLTPVLELFTKMADPIVADKDTIDASVPELPNMPTAFVAMISDLWGTILNVMMMLPMILINLIFKIFEVIMGMFDSIAGIIGVPSIPYPFSLVPQIIKLLPDIWEFIANTPGKITAIVKRIIMDKFKEIQYLTLPQPSIGGIAADTSFAVCPKHEKPQTENV